MQSSLLKCKKFEVVRRQLQGSDGKSHAREYVVHPGAVVVLPILSDGRFVMLDQYRQSIDRRLLELPAGTLDEPDESPLECAVRELAEETGYRAARWEQLCEFHPSPGILTEKITAFLATELTESQASPEPTENLIVRLLPAADALAGVLSGEIVDAKTMITLMYHHLRGVRP